MGAATAIGVFSLTVFVTRAQGPGGFGGFGPGFGGPGSETKLVKDFDKNGDKRLDAAERAKARASIANGGGNQMFRGGWRGGGGFPGAGGGGVPAPGPKLTPAQVRSYPETTPLYDLATLRTIFLQFEAKDWEQELSDFNDTDVDVPATMTVDGRTLKEVGVHFRGMSSFMMTPEGYKRPLNLSLDFAHEGQQLGGYRTLNLLNANGDPTFLRGVLYTEIARQFIPVPLMNYLRVVINGESWGIYLNAQQFNKDFTRDHFRSADGARWKVPGSPFGSGGLEYLGETIDEYKAVYEIKTKDTPKAWNDLISMTRVLNQTPPDKLEAALKPLLDIDGTLKFLALEVALVNSDGYWSRASDYSIYQDPKGMFHIIPHDVNEGLGSGGGGGGGRRGGGGFGGFGGEGGPDLDPLVGLNDSSKPLRSKLLAVPALRARYMTYIREIAAKLDWATLGPQARRYQALIAADVKTDTRKLYSTEQFSELSGLQSFIERRRAFLLAAKK